MVFDGLKIRQLIKNEHVLLAMSELESNAWLSEKDLSRTFLEIHEQRITPKMSRDYKSLGCNINIKLYFAYSHLHNFLENLDDVGDDNGEWFHQSVKAIEERYHMRWDVNVMANYSIKRESPRNLLL